MLRIGPGVFLFLFGGRVGGGVVVENRVANHWAGGGREGGRDLHLLTTFF